MVNKDYHISTENTLTELELSYDILRRQYIRRCFVDKHQKGKVDQFRYNTPPGHIDPWPLYTRSLPASTAFHIQTQANTVDENRPATTAS